MKTLLPVLAVFALSQVPAQAFDGPVEKRAFEIPRFSFRAGQTLPVRIGWESYGRLNAAKDNAILICHYFAGTSHAAGKYAPTGQPGYWDALIGPGKAIDTDRFFVVSADVLSNHVIGDPTMISTGPYSLDPSTKKPYGSRFPVVTVPDIVESQRLLMDSLGIPQWHAVMGASFGGMQALQWAVNYPERVPRLVAIATQGRSDAYIQGFEQIMIDAIQADANWKGGDYYGGPLPTQGLSTAFKVMYLNILSRTESSRRIPGAVSTSFSAELASAAARRVPMLDAGAYVQIARANRDFDLSRGHPDYESAIRRIQAKTLFIACEDDLLFPPEGMERALAVPFRKAGKTVEFRVLPTSLGHLGAISDLAKAAPEIGSFLSR